MARARPANATRVLVLVLLAACTARVPADKGKEPIATSYFHATNFTRANATDRDRHVVGLLRTCFRRAFSMSSDSTVDMLEADDIYPEDYEGNFAEAILTCPDPEFVIQTWDPVLPSGLLPTDQLIQSTHATRFPTAHLVSLFAEELFSDLRTDFESYMMHLIFAGRSRSVQRLETALVDGECSLQFLPGKGATVTFSDGSKFPFGHNITVNSHSAGVHPRRRVWPAPAEAVGAVRYWSPRLPEDGNPTDTLSCVQVPDGTTLEPLSKQESGANASASSLLEVEERLQARGIADDLPDMVKPVVSEILKPIMKLLGSYFGDVMITPIKDQMGQMTDEGLVSQIVEGLTQNLLGTLSKGIPAQTSESIPDVTAEGLSESLMVYLTEQLTNEITGPLTEKLSASLSESVPAVAESEAPARLTDRVTRVLIHSLTRSLTHSIVPSLTHAVTHSPLQDYYCYYCFHHKVYCQFCSYSPSQLYYSMYYAGYYSTYYGDYYSDFFGRRS